MQKEQLESLIEKGLSTYQIAKELGYSQSNIRHWLNKHGLKTKLTNNVSNTAETKICSKCSFKKDINEYYVIRRDNKSYYYSYCKSCSKTQFRINDRKRNQKDVLVEYKGGECEICGYKKCVSALEFHHKDPSLKEFQISTGAVRSKYDLDTLKREVDKCALLCANCHRELHAGLVELDSDE